MTLLQSGISKSDLIALNYGDVQNELEHGTLPLLLNLTRIKIQVEFRTFLGAVAIKFLRLYLETRTDLNSDSPLFTKWATDLNSERLLEETDGLLQ